MLLFGMLKSFCFGSRLYALVRLYSTIIYRNPAIHNYISNSCTMVLKCIDFSMRHMHSAWRSVDEKCISIEAPWHKCYTVCANFCRT